jgi:hypothetical protein
MGFSSRVCHRLGLLSWVIVSFLAAASSGRAQEFTLESVGMRYGFPTDHRGQGFDQAEVFLNWNLPRQWRLGPDWHVESRFDLSAGWLGRQRFNSALGTVGPTLVLRNKWLPVALEAGASVTGLSRGEFGSKDLGGLFQFTTHAGLNWDFAPHLRVGYRFQHMSNAGIRSPNPGLNLHVFAVSYLF